MSNSFFSFKQFTIQQGRCAMKVCTDACLFGAWVAKKAGKLLPEMKTAADIGTGTGLLSLMLAQKTTADIEAFEINEDAAQQAKQNFADSPWAERLTVNHHSATKILPGKKYDFILSNPPFYENELHSPDAARNAAMHDSELTLEDLMQVIKIHLANEGYAAVLLPFFRTGYFETLAIRNGYHITDRAYVRQSVNHYFFRSMVILSRDKPFNEKETEITIHDEGREYTEEFKELLRDYYLLNG